MPGLFVLSSRLFIDAMTSCHHRFAITGAKRVAKDSKKNTSLRLEAKTLKALKIRAFEDDTSVQKLVERLIEDYLKCCN